MKRWLAILGPQQVVFISNTHTPGKHRELFKDQEGTGRGRNQGSLVQVIKNRVSYTGPSTGNTHKQHSHRELFYDQEGTGRVRKKGSLG